MLDKYYRTITGFCVLIQKEWLHFGHKFGDRLGLNFTDLTYKDAERSPVFLQFLDAVYQILQQFPCYFEFTEDLLLTIMENAYSGRFGTFLFNYDSEREEAKLSEIAPSLWAYIHTNKSKYLNPFYVSNGDVPTVLYPSCAIQHLKFWSSYFLQHLSPPPLAHNQIVREGRQMKTTIQSLEAKVAALEKEKEELLLQLKESQGRERAMSNSSSSSLMEVNKPESIRSNHIENTVLQGTEEPLDEWVAMSTLKNSEADV